MTTQRFVVTILQATVDGATFLFLCSLIVIFVKRTRKSITGISAKIPESSPDVKIRDNCNTIEPVPPIMIVLPILSMIMFAMLELLKTLWGIASLGNINQQLFVTAGEIGAAFYFVGRFMMIFLYIYRLQDTFANSAYALSRQSKILLGLLCFCEFVCVAIAAGVRDKTYAFAPLMIAGITDTCLTIFVTALFNYKLFALMITQVRNVSYDDTPMSMTMTLSVHVKQKSDTNNAREYVSDYRQTPEHAISPIVTQKNDKNVENCNFENALLSQTVSIMSNWNEQQTKVALTLIQPITKYVMLVTVTVTIFFIMVCLWIMLFISDVPLYYFLLLGVILCVDVIFNCLALFWSTRLTQESYHKYCHVCHRLCKELCLYVATRQIIKEQRQVQARLTKLEKQASI